MKASQSGGHFIAVNAHSSLLVFVYEIINRLKTIFGFQFMIERDPADRKWDNFSKFFESSIAPDYVVTDRKVDKQTQAGFPKACTDFNWTSKIDLWNGFVVPLQYP